MPDDFDFDNQRYDDPTPVEAPVEPSDYIPAAADEPGFASTLD